MKNVKCSYCNDSGKIKVPNDETEFNHLVDIEADKAYFVNLADAREKAYKKVGFTYADCPHCKKNATK